MTELRAPWRYILLICLATILAFASGLDGVFLLDDHHTIINNPRIRTLWPPWAPFMGTTRPLVQATLALNYAISGLQTWSYHVVNIGVHLAAALTLFGLARRTLSRIPSLSANADGLAVVGAILWAVHPLQTESVTYIIQRAEAAMGLMVFLVLYTFTRAADEPAKSRQWLACALVASFAGFAIKPIMIVTPLLLWLFDRQFISGTFRGSLRAHPRFYLLLCLTPLVLPVFLAGNPAEWKDSAGVGSLPVTWYEYAATQPRVILHYLQLCLWPTPLCLDYGWPIERSDGVIAITSALVIGALGVTIWALIKKSAWGFLGAWFFVNLAPTSSVIPIADLAFEHRMYLALAAVSFAAVIAVHSMIRSAALGWVRPALAVLAIGFFTAFTVSRNRDYASEIRLWAANVAARPGYARPLNNLGLELARARRFDEAFQALRKAIEIDPAYAKAHYNLGKALLDSGNPAQARSHLEASIRLRADSMGHAALGQTLKQLGDVKGAVTEFANATRLSQGDLELWIVFGSTLSEANRHAEAVKVLEHIARVFPRSPQPLRMLAVLFAASPDDQIRQPQRALAFGKQSVAMTGGMDPGSLDALGMAQAESGDFDAAVQTAQHVLEMVGPDAPTELRSRLERYQSRKPWRLDALVAP